MAKVEDQILKRVQMVLATSLHCEESVRATSSLRSQLMLSEQQITSLLRELETEFELCKGDLTGVDTETVKSVRDVIDLVSKLCKENSLMSRANSSQ